LSKRNVIAAAELEISDLLKGIPGGVTPFRLGDAGRMGWNVLAEDMPLPLVILKDSALKHNSGWMRRFLGLTGALLAPHGKTTMSPQLFHRQLDDGAWAITLANVAQIQVARRFGIPRILLANQLIGRAAMNYVLGELKRDPGFEFLCLVDSPDGVAQLRNAAEKAAIGRPVEVLLEGGIVGRRTGCRTLADAMQVARAVKAAEPFLCLRGIEGFEGVVKHEDAAANAKAVTDFIAFLVEIAKGAAAENLFGAGPVILSAGGSVFYDIVARGFAAADLGRETKTVIRSGCYLSHDSLMLTEAQRHILARSPEAGKLGEAFKPALELWAYVQSRPEPGRVLLTFGKRDCSYDAGLPLPFAWKRPGPDPIGKLGADHRIVEVNDQHGFMDVPENSPLRVGDLVGCGVSHPCLTFDKWQIVPIVDDAYNVTSMIRTFF
jgi:D-serine dehydratase